MMLIAKLKVNWGLKQERNSNLDFILGLDIIVVSMLAWKGTSLMLMS
jgi:hypothetical protein